MTFCTIAMVFQASVLHLMWAVAVVVVRSLKWSSEPCCVGPPKTDASLFRVMTKCDPLEEGMANDPSILAMRTSWTVLKGKKVWQWKMSPPGWKVSDILQGKKGELLIALERMKRLGQSGSDAQLWMSGDENKIWCCKEQYFMGTWNIRSMNQGKLDTVKQDMVRININILGSSELRWMGMGKFNSNDRYIYYCGQESHRSSGVILIINKGIWNVVIGSNLKMRQWPWFVSKASHSTSW